MRQRRPIRTALLLAAASIAGIVGQLIGPAAWSTPTLAVMLAPAGYALITRCRRRSS